MNPHLSTLNSSLIIFKQTSLFKTFLDKAEIEMNKLLYVDFFAAHSTMNQAMRSTIERRSLLMDSITLFNQATTKLEKENEIFFVLCYIGRIYCYIELLDLENTKLAISELTNHNVWDKLQKIVEYTNNNSREQLQKQLKEAKEKNDFFAGWDDFPGGAKAIMVNRLLKAENNLKLFDLGLQLKEIVDYIDKINISIND